MDTIHNYIFLIIRVKHLPFNPNCESFQSIIPVIFPVSLPFSINVSIRSREIDRLGVDTRIYFLPDNPFLPCPPPRENWIPENERKKILPRLIHSTVFDVAKGRPRSTPLFFPPPLNHVERWERESLSSSRAANRRVRSNSYLVWFPRGKVDRSTDRVGGWKPHWET